MQNRLCRKNWTLPKSKAFGEVVNKVEAKLHGYWFENESPVSTSSCPYLYINKNMLLQLCLICYVFIFSAPSNHLST